MLIWANQTLTDSEGFISTDTIHLEQTSYAVITQPADIDIDEHWPWDLSDLATIKVEASNNNSSKQIFIGIAEESDIDNYLDDVEYDEITEFRIHPYEVDYINNPGSSVPADPASQTFWEASSYGTGTQTLEWELEGGTWVLVLMNTDGSAGVDLDGSVGINAPWLFGLGIGLLFGGAIALLSGAVMLYFAIRKKQG